jgi:protein-disulfide isomerase
VLLGGSGFVASCAPLSGDSRATPPTASVLVVEFADFQCPACRRFALNHWPSVQARFGDSVALVFRHWPQAYHPHAYGAAIAAVCAGQQGRFAHIHNLFYLEQEMIGRKSFLAFAAASGVQDLAAFAKCATGPEARAIVDADIGAARAIGGTGTPTLVINGVRHRLRADTTWLPRLVDSLLREAARR